MSVIVRLWYVPSLLLGSGLWSQVPGPRSEIQYSTYVGIEQLKNLVLDHLGLGLGSVYRKVSTFYFLYCTTLKKSWSAMLFIVEKVFTNTVK